MTGSKPRICVGMSGGVDSSVAAYLLREQGYEVIGLTFRGWPQDCRSLQEDKCCGPQAVMDARMVAHALGIAYYVIDEIETFRREVMDYFAAEYRQGRTPNPCVICNEKVKFGSLLRKARGLGAEQIATGHYARVIHGPRHELRRARDRKKDQSYFLFTLSQEQLARTVFPLGEMTKQEVRALAQRIGLKTYGKEESQEVCFVPENDYRRFLREEAGLGERPGEIVTRDGRVLGQHTGIHNFTIGQREGLRLGGLARPVYVLELQPATNRVVVGPAEELLRDCFEVAHVVWHIAEPVAPIEVTVKPRHQHPGCAAVVERGAAGRWIVRLEVPQRAITPGQAAVFYQADRVVGGGWIC